MYIGPEEYKNPQIHEKGMVSFYLGLPYVVFDKIFNGVFVIKLSFLVQKVRFPIL